MVERDQRGVDVGCTKPRCETKKLHLKAKPQLELTATSMSITSLHVCRLVALVTSKSSSLVVFLICRAQSAMRLTTATLK